MISSVMDIHRQFGWPGFKVAWIKIDYTAPLEDLGLYRPVPFAREGAAAGREAALRAAARYAAEGDRLGKIEDRSFSFGELGEAAWAGAWRELNLAALSPPTVTAGVVLPRRRGGPGAPRFLDFRI